jgi:hypothetical protein
MSDWIYDALGQFQQYMDGLSVGSVLFVFLGGLLLAPLATLVHEAGHALAARRYGVPVHALVSSGEGPSVAFSTRTGVQVRLGLGLGRDLRSSEPLGWVLVDSSRLAPREATIILLAGPAAQGLFGVLVLSATIALPMATDARVLFALGALGTCANALSNLVGDAGGHSDGAKIRQLRASANAPSAVSIPQPDPRAATSGRATVQARVIRRNAAPQ